MRSARARVFGGFVAALVWLGAAGLATVLPSPWGQILGGLLIVAAAYCLVWLAESQAAAHTERSTREHNAAIERLREAAEAGRRREAALAHTTDAVLIVLDANRVEYANPTARMFLQDRVLEVTNRLNQPDLERLVDLARTTKEPVVEDVTLWPVSGRAPRA